MAQTSSTTNVAIPKYAAGDTPLYKAEFNASMDKLDALINTMQTALNKLKPIVGDMVVTYTNVNPGARYGGTWMQVKDKFLLGAGDTYAGASTGGSPTQKFKYKVGSYRYYGSNVGQDANGMMVWDYTTGAWKASTVYATVAEVGNSGMQTATQAMSPQFWMSEGETETKSILPPYQTVYIWRCTVAA